MVTPEAARMDEIVAASACLLKAEGFRKRRHSFNRRTSAGLVHVVNFWQAPKEPPAWNEVPGLRERLYGTFRLDFGVYVPQMARTGEPKSQWINDYNCELRRTIGQLRGEPGDCWWPLTDTDAEVRSRVALIDHGLPWLARFADHDDVLEAFKTSGPHAIGMSPAGGLDVAHMLTTLDRKSEARELLEAYVSRPVLTSHAGYLANYLDRMGHADLIPRSHTRD